MRFVDYRLMAEPRGETYRELVRFAADLGGQFGLVMRDREPESQLPDALRNIAHHLTSDHFVSGWPGTTLLGHQARQLTFALDEESASCLCGTVEALFDWKWPLPEDLHFLDARGHWWLGSIAHERDGFVRLDTSKETDIRSKLPGLTVEWNT